MKAQAIRQENVIQKHFFLLMIVPLLIGLMISLTTFAYAEWNTQDDPLLNTAPTKQGWEQIQTHRIASKTHQGEGKL